MSIKLINFKCPDCNFEEKDLFDSIELKFMICPKCGTHMKEFNFKNNSQRVFICDLPQK